MTFMMGASQQITTGGGADVTPDAVNWSDVTDFPSPIYTDTQQIKGISSSITLEVEIVFADSGYTLEVGVNNSNSYGGTITDVTGGGTFTVDNNQYVTFKLTGGFGTVEFKVINNSDANTTLDSIIMSIGF